MSEVARGNVRTSAAFRLPRTQSRNVRYRPFGGFHAQENLVIAVVAFIAGAAFWSYGSRAVHALGANVVHILRVYNISDKPPGDIVKVSGEVIGFSCAGDTGGMLCNDALARDA